MLAVWDRVCQRACDERPELSGAITNLHPHHLDDDTVAFTTIAPNRDPGTCTEAQQVLVRHVSQVLGRSLRLGQAHHRAAVSAVDASQRNQAYAQAQTDPVVRELMRRFEAEVIAREPSPRARWLEQRTQAANEDNTISGS